MSTSSIGYYIKAPINTFIEVAFHTLDNGNESLLLRISDRATAFFGAVSFLSSVHSTGWAIKYGVDVGVGFVVSTPYPPTLQEGS